MEAGYGFNPSLSLWLHMLPAKFVGMQKYFRIIFCRIWNLISHVLLLCDKFLQSSGLTFFIRRPYKFFGRMVLSWTESSFSILQTPQIWSWKHLKIFFFLISKFFINWWSLGLTYFIFLGNGRCNIIIPVFIPIIWVYFDYGSIKWTFHAVRHNFFCCLVLWDILHVGYAIQITCTWYCCSRHRLNSI